MNVPDHAPDSILPRPWPRPVFVPVSDGLGVYRVDEIRADRENGNVERCALFLGPDARARALAYCTWRNGLSP